MKKAVKSSKNKELLTDFVKYAKAHSDERFYQCLRNWMNVDAVCVARGWGDVGGDTHTSIEYVDTFFWEKKSDLEFEDEE